MLGKTIGVINIKLVTLKSVFSALDITKVTGIAQTIAIPVLNPNA